MPDYNQFALDRLTNLGNTAEGTNLPPRQTGQIRVPIVSNLRVVGAENTTNGPLYTLAWLDPDAGGSQIVQYNIFAVGLDGTEEPQGPFTARRSPVNIRLTTKGLSQIRFIVQTQLHNGMTSHLEISPTVATPTVSGFGSLSLPVKTVSNTYTIVNTDYLIIGDTTSSSFSIYLPPSPSNGDSFCIKKSVAANILTLNGNGHNIDGSASIPIYVRYLSYSVLYNGTEWSII